MSAIWTAALPGLQEQARPGLRALAELRARPELERLPERPRSALPERAAWAQRQASLPLLSRRGALGVQTLARRRAEAALPERRAPEDECPSAGVLRPSGRDVASAEERPSRPAVRGR